MLYMKLIKLDRIIKLLQHLLESKCHSLHFTSRQWYCDPPRLKRLITWFQPSFSGPFKLDSCEGMLCTGADPGSILFSMSSIIFSSSARSFSGIEPFSGCFPTYLRPDLLPGPDVPVHRLRLHRLLACLLFHGAWPFVRR